jgi:hypothetical protein
MRLIIMLQRSDSSMNGTAEMALEKKKTKSRDRAALVVIVLTTLLFIAALFLKGFTHDLLLEGAIFLVSAKLVLMAKANAETERRLELQLVEIKALLESLPRELERIAGVRELIERPN